MTADFDFFSTSAFSSTRNNVTYNLLTDITYPTAGVTKYAYAKETSNTLLNTINGSKSGFLQYYRITSRQDLDGSTVYNRAAYTYSANNYSGYPTTAYYDKLPDSFTYSMTAKWDDNTEKVYTFNNKHLNTVLDVKLAGVQKKKTTVTYNGRVKLDTKNEILSDNPNNSLIQCFPLEVTNGKKSQGIHARVQSKNSPGDTAGRKYA